MKRFMTDKLRKGDIVAVRSTTTFGKLIRLCLGSYTNHNGMMVVHFSQWMIGEAVEPVSKLTDLGEYESKVAQGSVWIRVFRVSDSHATDEERQAVNDLFVSKYLGIKYPLSVARLWIFRFVNSLPWKVRGEWCTRLVWEPWERVCPGVFDTPQGKRKNNPTPRTYENRLVAGVVADITDDVFC